LITDLVLLGALVVCGCLLGAVVVTVCLRVDVVPWLLPEPQPASTATEAKATTAKPETLKASGLTVDDTRQPE
jgi:hypothetical protein